jgi:hypothetical protein
MEDRPRESRLVPRTMSLVDIRFHAIYATGSTEKEPPLSALQGAIRTDMVVVSALVSPFGLIRSGQPLSCK